MDAGKHARRVGLAGWVQKAQRDLIAILRGPRIGRAAKRPRLNQTAARHRSERAIPNIKTGDMPEPQRAVLAAGVTAGYIVFERLGADDLAIPVLKRGGRYRQPA